MLGKSILHYRIIEKLGEGGMGVVYLAEDSKLKRRVAIKFLPGHIASNSDERKRFEVEAQAAAALNHPNIATIYSIEEVDDELFIVMEYISGKHLKDHIGSKALPVDEALKTAIQIARGLQEAHNNGVVHRDIKSANIMQNDKGQIKIMDFGLAKVGEGIELTKTQSTLGTVAYMSPEQTKGENVDQRSDIWSFGVVLYEMLTGMLPFRGDYEQAVIYSILNEEAPVPPNDIPDEIWTILKKILAKERNERYSSFDELLADIIKLNKTASNYHIVPFLKKPFIALPLVILLVFITWWIYNNTRANHVRQNIMPKIEQLAEDVTIYDNGLKAWTVFELANQAKEIIDDDPLLMAQYPKFSNKIDILTDPSSARVYAKATADTSASWTFIGISPLDSIWFPEGYSHIKVEKEGYQTAYDLIWNAYFINDTMSFVLKPENDMPPEMVLVDQSANSYNIPAAPAGLHLPGLEHLAIPNVGSFLMDRYEVSNAQFKEFLKNDGYKNPKWWGLLKEAVGLDFERIIASFTDKTGQPGPSTWEVGDFPAGQDHFPVCGVSLYEAAAYAKYAGKNLPTIYHWDRAAFAWSSSAIVPFSNLAAKYPVRTGHRIMNRFGIYDMAGNVREWCINKSSRGGYFILGGGWDDPAYAFNDAYAQSAMDRSKTNGIRCIKYLAGEDALSELQAEVKLPFRDFLNEKNISDETFKIYLKQYAYDKMRLDAKSEAMLETENWIRQKVSFNAAYGNERMAAYLFLPKSVKTPYQTLIYFPGSGAIHTRSSKDLSLSRRNEFLIKSGRALVIPIYKSTYERGDGLKSDYPEMTNFWKDHIIMWTKDFSRTIDYLETRNDIDKDKIVYLGASWGGAMGGIIPAVEKRIKGSILIVAGLLFQPSLDEVEPLYYLPRITCPVLMLNGKYDFFFPYETSQLPFYTLLGTREEDKKILVYEESHSVPHTELIKESLAWLDKYLGPVD